jgi:hypothetical protein
MDARGADVGGAERATRRGVVTRGADAAGEAAGRADGEPAETS